MNAYWAQMDRAEILSMHGIDLDDYHEEDEITEEKVPEGEENCCFGGCMDCLGLSWRDFY